MLHGLCSGNLEDLFARKGWDFHQELLEGYGGPVVKLHGLAGVSLNLCDRV